MISLVVIILAIWITPGHTQFGDFVPEPPHQLPSPPIPHPPLPLPPSLPKPSVAAPSLPNPSSLPSPGDAAGSMVKSGPPSMTPPQTVNGSALVDKVITLVKPELVRMGLESVAPPDVDFIEDSCKVHLHDGKITGLTDFHRLGDVVTVSETFSTKFRSALKFTRIVYTTKLSLSCDQPPKVEEGSMVMTCDNATVFQVYKLDHVTQLLTLDEFEFSLGPCQNVVEGVGERGAAVSEKAMEKAKPVLIKIFNVSFKIAVNVGLQGARAALFG